MLIHGALLLNIFTPLILHIYSLYAEIPICYTGMVSAAHESLCSMVSFISIRSHLRDIPEKRSSLQRLFPLAFLALAFADLLFGVMAYLVQLPPPRGNLPLIHSIPYLCFISLLAGCGCVWASTGLDRRSFQQFLAWITLLSLVFLFCTVDLILVPFHKAVPTRSALSYGFAWLYSIAASIASAALIFLSLRTRSLLEFIFWFGFLILMGSDFALRYQDIGGPIGQLGLFELIWQIALATQVSLLIYCRLQKKVLFQPLLPLFSLKVFTGGVAAVSLSLFVFLERLLLDSPSIHKQVFQNHAFQIYQEAANRFGALILLLLLIWSVANGLALSLLHVITRGIRRLESELKQIGNLTDLQSLKFGPIELAPLISALISMSVRISEFIEENITLRSNAKLGEAAEQFSHDIRAPLAALKSICLRSQQLDDKNKELLKATIGRIQEISSSLLQRSDLAEPSLASEPLEWADPTPHLRTLLEEKKAQYSCYPGISFSLSIQSDSIQSISQLRVSQFKRIVSGLIDNSVEAIRNTGHISILLDRTHGKAQVTVLDNGRGIPYFILSQLGKHRVSFGKRNGSGLGILHAREKIESWGGELLIQSHPNSDADVVTRVTLKLISRLN